MKVRLAALILTFSAAACVEEPTVKDADAAIETMDVDKIEAKQLSIEQAAEAATKLIEDDARKEADAAEPSSNTTDKQ